MYLRDNAAGLTLLWLAENALAYSSYLLLDLLGGMIILDSSIVFTIVEIAALRKMAFARTA